VKVSSHAVADRSDPLTQTPADATSGGSSFEELAVPLFAPLYNFACWLAQDRHEAEDLVQETYAKALKGFASFAQGTNFRAWMYRILRNSFLNSRTGMRAASIPIDDDSDQFVLPPVEDNPESLLLTRADQERIRAALERLPLRFREVILLCDMEEMSYREIASTLGIPLGTVMSRLSRARAAMRELLQCPSAEGLP
jgi:RNA polymerase sigma-70 factor (ECF subfamily)